MNQNLEFISAFDVILKAWNNDSVSTEILFKAKNNVLNSIQAYPANSPISFGDTEHSSLSVNDLMEVLADNNQYMNYCDAIVLDQNNGGKLLINQRTNSDEFQAGKWCLPGGKAEQGEFLRDAVKRELFEETGLIATSCNYSTLYRNPDGSFSHYFYCYVEDCSQLMVDADEVQQYAWIDLKDLDQYDFMFDLVDRIKAIFNVPFKGKYLTEQELAALAVNKIEKGKKANIGETRVWDGVKVQKQADGEWKEVPIQKKNTIGSIFKNKQTSDSYLDIRDFFFEKLGEDYESNEKRKSLFNNAKPVEINIEDIVPNQDYLDEGTLNKYEKDGNNSPSLGVRINGKVILFDGHHRVASDIINGKLTSTIKILEGDSIQKAHTETSLETSYSKGCLMLDMPTDLKSDWHQIQSKIKHEDIYSEAGFGRETNPHITVLYGFKLPDVTPEHIERMLPEHPVSFKIVDVSYFESEDYDVLKFGIESEQLHQLNSLFKLLPNENKFPDYKPHCTIAYLKKGRAERYIETFKSWVNYQFQSSEFDYSHNDEDGLKTKSHWDVKGFSSIEDSHEDKILKGRAANIGETRIWDGKKMQKQANGEWKDVSEILKPLIDFGGYDTGNFSTEGIFNRKYSPEMHEIKIKIFKKKGMDFYSKENFDKSEEVELKDLIPTQKHINKIRINQEISAEEEPLVYRKGEELYVFDGHHRVVEQILNRKEKIKVRIRDFEESDFKEENIEKSFDQDELSTAEYFDLLKAQQYQVGQISQKTGLKKVSAGVWVDPNTGKQVKVDEQGNPQTAKKPVDVNKYTFEELSEYAKNSSQADLEAIVKESREPKLRQAAHQELDRRSKKEAVQEKKELTKKAEPKKEAKTELKKEEKINLKFFEELASESKSAEELYEKIQEIKNVPPDTATEFFEKYGDGGLFSPRRATQNMFEKITKPESQQLSNEEKEAISDYTGLDYRKINNFLNKGWEPDEQMKIKIENISKALKKIPDYKGQVYRGISATKELNEHLSDFENNIGGEIEFPAFSSTSQDKNMASKFGSEIFFEIKSNSGKPIKEYSEMKHENEVLFDKGSKFKIKKVKKNMAGSRLLSMNVILEQV